MRKAIADLPQVGRNSNGFAMCVSCGEPLPLSGELKKRSCSVFFVRFRDRGAVKVLLVRGELNPQWYLRVLPLLDLDFYERGRCHSLPRYFYVRRRTNYYKSMKGEM